MDNFKLHCIITISDMRSFSKAAESLYVSQPYLSKVVASIEGELGMKLFDRSHTPLTVTEAGSCYIEYAMTVLHAEKIMLEKLKSIQDIPTREITLGMGISRIPYILPKLMQRFTLAYPKIQLKIYEGNSNSAMARMITAGDLDLSFYTSPELPQNVSCCFLAKERFYMILPPDYPVSRSASASKILSKHDLKQISGIRFIVLSEQHGAGQYARKMFQDYGISPHSLYVVSDLETAHRMAAEGFGATIIPEAWKNRIQLDSPPVYYQIDDPPFERTVVMLYPQKHVLTAVEKSICEMIRDIMNSL